LTINKIRRFFFVGFYTTFPSTSGVSKKANLVTKLLKTGLETLAASSRPLKGERENEIAITGSAMKSELAVAN